MLCSKLIVANGPFLPLAIIQECARGRRIIALDGAADQLEHRGIKPHIILGDFDSIKEKPLDTEPFVGRDGITFIPAPDQNFTDLQKAIQFCDQEGATRIDIVCALGGQIDHCEGNIRALTTHYRINRPIFIHSEEQTLEYVCDQTVEVNGIMGDHCGLLAAPACSFICENEGLAWSSDAGKPYVLRYGITEGTRNRLVKEKAIIEIKGQALIVHPPFLKAQREFSALSRVEQLRKLLKEAK